MKESLFLLDPYIAKIPDFRKATVTYYDISSAVQDPHAFYQTRVAFCKKASACELDLLVCLNARGFLFGSAATVRL